MATSLMLRAIGQRQLTSSFCSPLRSLSGNEKTVWSASPLCKSWSNLARPFSSKPAGNDVIGIDLGTTNSCVAVMEGKNAKVIEYSEGVRTTPSALAFNQKGELLVGTPAKQQVKATNGDTFLGGEDFDNAGIFTRLINRNTTIPTKRSQEIFTMFLSRCHCRSFSHHSKANGEPPLFLDTVAMVGKLEDEGVAPNQAAVIAKTLSDGMQNAAKSLVVKQEMQEGKMAQEANLFRFHVEMKRSQEHQVSLFQEQIDKFRHHVDNLNLEFRCKREKTRDNHFLAHHALETRVEAVLQQINKFYIIICLALPFLLLAVMSAL